MHWVSVRLSLLVVSITFAACSPWSGPLSEVEHHEIVRPRLVDFTPSGKDLPHSKVVYPERVSYSVHLQGEELILRLEKNGELLVRHYSETHYTENGTEVVDSPQLKDHCYYHGIIEGFADSSVSVSTCTGLRGILTIGTAVYLIEPLDESGAEEHVVYRQEHLRVKRGSCIQNITLYDNGPKVAALYQPPSRRSMHLSHNTRYVELFLVVDNTEYRKFNQEILTIRHRMMEIVNHVDKLYRSLNIRVALVGLEVWTHSDKIVVSPNPDTTLDNFLMWRGKELISKKRHDNAQLVTGRSFDGTTVGLATKSAMCSYQSGGVNEDHNRNPIGLASTIAHEMGHNLGMSHDEDYNTECTCDTKNDGGCIMAKKTGIVFPKSFSSCSYRELQMFLATERTNCLLNSPTADELYGSPKCGNQFLERGEECDCGTIQECTNPCCNATTCKLKDGVECSDGGCCQNCKIQPAGQMCRIAQHDCDLTDYCDGLSSQCPEDAFKMNGSPCGNGEGYCYNGRCPTPRKQCIVLWGPDATVASDHCFRQNMRGNMYLHCRATEYGHEACQAKDIKCGKMHCVGGNKFPVTQAKYEVELSHNVLCKIAMLNKLSEAESDPGLVPTGTKCGNEMVCYNGRCQSLLFYGARNCSSKCNNHGVCNHKGECHCDPGWAKPYCATQTDGSAVRDNAIIITLAVLLPFIILLIIISGGLLYYKGCLMKKYIKNLPIKSTSCGLSNPTFVDGKDRNNCKVTHPSSRSSHLKHSLLDASKEDRRLQITVIPSRPAPLPPKPDPIKTLSVNTTAKSSQHRMVKPNAPPPVPPSKPVPTERVPVRPPPPPCKPLPELKAKPLLKPMSQPPVLPVKPGIAIAPSKPLPTGFKPKVALKPPNQHR
ncbi:disintegrin and metalloproteinase domain-containing protein 8-like isoform X1 [Hypanus sabinus]|uniref:disintegrin and metalloproteinase domain-containing protein 8-like isoform X1 n=1 Tax=Hypanus sabinus TaxID=79690 RepID=UPI0028C47878|nr:disintegrin and metalloproteinase domain-containing protein 8-like isoform X1 [Hypanus sabinus]